MEETSHFKTKDGNGEKATVNSTFLPIIFGSGAEIVYKLEKIGRHLKCCNITGW